eukprot:gene12802-26989_t
MSRGVAVVYRFRSTIKKPNAHIKSNGKSTPNSKDKNGVDKRQKKSIRNRKSNKTPPSQSSDGNDLEFDEEGESSNNDEDSSDEFNKGNTKSKSKKSKSKSGDMFYKLSRGIMSVSKKSMKSGFDLLAGKHVTLNQFAGKWKFSQDVEIKPDIIYSCPATIQFLQNGTVITKFNDKEYITKFKFTERPWPRACTIKFDAYAFLGPTDTEPIHLFYSGYFKRSLFNKKLLLMRGKIYRMTGKIWKRREKCGKFKATQRRYR